MPVYGLLIIFMAPTLYNYLPLAVKKIVIFIVLINNVLLPLSLIPFFIHNNLIRSWFMNERSDRMIPLIISTILYFITTYIIFRFQVPISEIIFSCNSLFIAYCNIDKFMVEDLPLFRWRRCNSCACSGPFFQNVHTSAVVSDPVNSCRRTDPFVQDCSLISIIRAGMGRISYRIPGICSNYDVTPVIP